MARPLEQPGPVSLLEEAAHLLRRAPLDTLLCHWIGSVPFALALLIPWNDLTHPPVPDLVCAAKSLVAALLLIWMNCWRSVFAGRLHRQLTGAAEMPWTRSRVWRLVSNQAFLAATKLFMLPLSLAAIFPFATTVAFYRNAAVLADRGDLDPLALISKARRLARIDRFQCWLLQALLLPLSLIAMLNVAVTFIVLPGLVKMLTGYESAFSRSGAGFVQNPLFLMLVLTATWLVFDPFVQAVYCLRCFQGESVETGEDLRAGLRRVRMVLIALVLAVLPSLVARAADSVGPGELEQSVRQTMQSPDYNWRIPPPAAAASGTPWIILATDRAMAAVQSAMKWIGKAIVRLLGWIFGGLDLNPMPLGGQAPTAALHWSVWVLIGLAVALAGWVVWRARLLRRKKTKAKAARLRPRPSNWTMKGSPPTASPKPAGWRWPNAPWPMAICAWRCGPSTWPTWPGWGGGNF